MCEETRAKLRHLGRKGLMSPSFLAYLKPWSISQIFVEITGDNEPKTGNYTVFREINVSIIERIYSRSN